MISRAPKRTLKALVATLLCGTFATAAFADTTTINGAGSTWSAVAIDQWRADVSNSRGLSVNYNTVGSSAGRERFISLPEQTDFAVSEIPFLPDEVYRLSVHHRAYQYLPIVAGGTALMYNLKDSAGRQIRDLRLSPTTVAGIFTGKIRFWDDKRVVDDYGKALPHTPVIPVVRSDGSGTSAQFAAFLKHEVPSLWNPFAKANALDSNVPVSNYPLIDPLIGQSGSDGIANYVAQPGIGLGAIGYLESAYAVQRNFPVAAVENHSGKFVLPTSHAVSTALKAATLNSDRTQNLGSVYTNANPLAYPISSYSYMIVPKASADAKDLGLSPDKSAVLGKFMLYFACDGQASASLLGYSPLPKNLVSIVYDAVKALPAGHPAVTAEPTAANCKNPQMTGDLGAGADMLRGSLAYGASAGTTGGTTGTTTNTGTQGTGTSTPGGTTAPTNGAGTGADTDTGTGSVTGTGGTGTNPGVYSNAEPTAIVVHSNAGTTLTWAGIVVSLVLLAPLMYAAVRRRKRSLLQK
jgi:ABC-type phosphate transport system substrate-binding protein